MSTLEKITGAIAREAGHNHPTLAHARQARAALEAMRETSRPVLQAGAYAYDDERAILPVWTAMIDAILSGEA